MDIDLADCPDLGPVLMVLGLLCEGTTVIRNAERLRLKESDRIAAMEAELRACGGVLESEGGTITVHGCADRLLSLIHILGDTKNIVGAFWQPKLVIVDPDTLATLPRRHFINGLAEAVKASLLADPELFAIFENGDVDAQIGEIICRSLRFKKNIVEQDETEQGMRKALNFGHTIGHGIEAVKGIKGRRTVGLYHGECVALGMLPMIESKALQKRVRAVYRRLGLPTRTTYDKEKVLAEMLHDKKAQSGQITIIKVPGLGCWRAETIPVEGLRPLLGIEE